MGPFRRRLIALATLLPTPALAEVCDKINPDFDGTPVSALQEAATLSLSPISLIILAITLIAVRFRNQWVGLVSVLLWAIFVTVITMADPTGVQIAARSEGCIGSPALFIALVIAICIGTVLYTAPIKAPKDGDT